MCHLCITLTSQTKLYLRLADSSVLYSSIATVIGPTPPGTGVMEEATLDASSKHTSPISR